MRTLERVRKQGNQVCGGGARRATDLSDDSLLAEQVQKPGLVGLFGDVVEGRLRTAAEVLDLVVEQLLELLRLVALDLRPDGNTDS
jgi:hypothetical protein